ncbi:MAG: tRNA (N(6)-L-threonylcarbamoyladenosine(37)-C(2))-methylthiotransferase MtaB [Bacteroidales bacterium]|nr:tRNA (N(6)-L-threonylcarbamoyladenosine(37)-C(2))-methylthiotransferase MtaB [Bacteroidales bacterium]
MNKRIALHTLGCKLNFAEGTQILKQFVAQEFEVVDFKQPADIYIINTCTVTQIADSKSRHFIRHAHRTNPEAIIIVTGCYAQISATILSAISGVDYIIGNSEKKTFFNNINDLKKQDTPQISVRDIEKTQDFFPSFSLHERTRSFLKVQDGCNYYCNYCTIPFTRGHSRNPAIGELVSQTREIAHNGIKEIILTGINIGDFGHSTGETFFDLLKALDKVEDIARYRISSIEPNLLTNEMIEWIAESKRFAPHFHIPLQSGSDKILRIMQRRYSVRFFADKINTIYKILPHAGIGIDVITGYPAETEKDFEDTYKLLTELPASYLHVFSYSERPLAESKNLKQLNTKQEIDLRSKKLHQLSNRKKQLFTKRNTGTSTKVLFESENKDGQILGLTGNYIRVTHPFNEQLKNRFLTVSLQPDDNPIVLQAKITDNES